MTGTTTLRLTPETMMEALKYYFNNRVFKEPMEVNKVYSVESDTAFEVEITPDTKEGDE